LLPETTFIDPDEFNTPKDPDEFNTPMDPEEPGTGEFSLDVSEEGLGEGCGVVDQLLG
jgi:hypothetical protein